ncbi:MAG: thiol:disulfide interchange protein DsbA/DsbL [Pseudomonadota bacterium]
MNRLALGVMFGLLLFASGNAAAEAFEEGTHYVELQIPVKTRTPNKIEVAEYFSYGCPHCFEFEPMINQWKSSLPEDVVFKRTPAVWNRDYQVYAQTYYTSEALNVLDTMHTPVFRAIHMERRRLNDPELMAKFFGEYGVDPVDFAKTYASFGVRASVQQAEALGRAYRARGVPTLVVNGKYRVESAMAGSNANMLRVVDFLIGKERAALASD